MTDPAEQVFEGEEPLAETETNAAAQAGGVRPAEDPVVVAADGVGPERLFPRVQNGCRKSETRLAPACREEAAATSPRAPLGAQPARRWLAAPAGGRTAGDGLARRFPGKPHGRRRLCGACAGWGRQGAQPDPRAFSGASAIPVTDGDPGSARPGGRYGTE